MINIYLVRFPKLNCSCSMCDGKILEKIALEELCIVVTLKGSIIN